MATEKTSASAYRNSYDLFAHSQEGIDVHIQFNSNDDAEFKEHFYADITELDTKGFKTRKYGERNGFSRSVEGAPQTASVDTQPVTSCEICNAEIKGWQPPNGSFRPPAAMVASSRKKFSGHVVCGYCQRKPEAQEWTAA